MTTIHISNGVANEHESKKLAATQHQLIDLAQRFDSLYESHECLKALLDNNQLSTAAKAQPVNDRTNDALLAQIQQLAQAAVEWENFKHSRTYRWSQYYVCLYEKPLIGPMLKLTRKAFTSLRIPR